MPVAERLSGELLRYITPAEATRGTHGLFRYPAKYLPQIARALLGECAAPGDRILDPFCGSGTTLVEASRLRMPSIGLDLNPLAVLLSNVKCRAVDADAFLAAGKRATRRAERAKNVFIPEFRNRDYWFPPEALDPLSRLRRAITEERDLRLREALLVVFLSIVKEASNASTYHYKLTRSREPDPLVGPAVYERFAKRVARAAPRFGELTMRAPAACLTGDSRRLPFPDGSFRAVVTHPPYSISFEFVRVFKIFLWWLDPDRNTSELDRLMVGNQRRFTGDLPVLGVPEIDEISARVYERDVRDGLAVAWFYRDMDRALREYRRVLAPGGRLALFMGDSQARWIPIEAPGNLLRLAERAGFELVLRLPRPVPEKASSSIRQIHVEEILLFAR